jgi:diaminopimelate epimerase
MHFINTGVPHVVVFVDTVETLQIQDIGRKIRFHQQFQPAGTNVNFVSVASDSQLLIRTYERGVEDETMACGTGSVAAALVASALGKVPLPVKVKTQGGEILTVAAEHAAYPFGHVYLAGAVRMICAGELWEEAYT